MESRVRRRRQRGKVANACEQCKARKVKCTGNNPCEPCQTRAIDCIFHEAEKKVLVSESYLRKLQHAHAAAQEKTVPTENEAGKRPSPKPTPGAQIPPSSEEENAPDGEQITNPLVSTTSFYLQDTSGRFRFCGPSSSWSFSQRVFLLLMSVIPDFPAPDIPFHMDGTTWQLNWGQTNLDNTPLLEGLPSLNDSLYLLSVVKFHSYQILFLFDEDEFVPHLRELYERGVEKAQSMPLWFIQYLLIIALAKAHLAASRNPKSPPGFMFFQRAMSLMPDFVGLNRRPNLAMQVLYLAGLYFLSVDMKDAAYAYIGQSIRMCIMEGLHRDPPDDMMGTRFANQCRNIWWTAYILDRQVSAMIGAPNSIEDAEITCSYPTYYDDSEMAAVLTLHVRLSQIYGHVLKTVYTADLRQMHSFISSVQEVLTRMAALLQDIEEAGVDASHPSLRTVSVISSHLYLRYHQCIILTTRPLFLYLLSAQVKRAGRQSRFDEFIVPPQLRPLLATSIQSAKISIRTLFTLYEQSSLDSFLSFDLDNMTSSAFLLALSNIIDPNLLPDQPDYMTATTKMLAELVAKGNLAGALRSAELELLQKMTVRIFVNSTIAAQGIDENTLASNLDHNEQTAPLEAPWADGAEDVSMSYTQIFDLADQLDTVTENSLGTDFDFAWGNVWFQYE